MKITRYFTCILLLIITLPITSSAQEYMRWNLPERAKLRIGKGMLYGDIAFSPDSKRLAVTTPIGIWIYDVYSGKELDLLMGHQEGVASVAYSPDGKILASGSREGKLLLWDVSTGKVIKRFMGHQAEILGVAFSPDGNILASCGGRTDESVILWDVNSGVMLTIFTEHSDKVSNVIFSPDGKFLASSTEYENEVILWDVESLRLKKFILGHKDGVQSIAFSPDGSILAGGSDWSDNSIHLWNTDTGELINTLSGHTRKVNSVSFSSDGNTLASGGDDGTVVLWDISTATYKTTLLDHTYRVQNVLYSPDGNLLVSSSLDGTIQIRNAVTLETITQILGHNTGVDSFAISPNGDMIVLGSWDNKLHLWKTATGKKINTLIGHTDSIESIDISPDGKTIASSGSYYDRSVRLWDAVTGKTKLMLMGHNGDINVVRFSPDGKMLATAGRDNNVCLWDTQTGHHLTTFIGDSHNPYSLAFSQDGQMLASGGQDILLWDLSKRKQVRRFGRGYTWIRSLTFSPNGNTLAAVFAYRIVNLWDVETGTLKRELTQPEGRFSGIAYSPNGQFLISMTNSDGGTISFWDPGTAEIKHQFTGIPDGFGQIRISRDGSTVATAGDGGVIYIWDFDDIIQSMSLTADVNRDGIVDIKDLIVVATNFNKTGPHAADINGDGVVDITDLVMVAAAINLESASPAKTPYKDILKASSIKEWLKQAQIHNLTDPVSKRGIYFLEQLLNSKYPEKTAALPNYPNPFNPETWIPYQLSESSDISIRIYSTNGQLIRRLQIGQQQPGLYHSRSRAAYWDGKNELGELVSSGIYFYEFTAGHFSTTRQMVIRK